MINLETSVYKVEQTENRWRVTGPDCDDRALYLTKKEAEKAAAVFNRAARARQHLGLPAVQLRVESPKSTPVPPIDDWQINTGLNP